MHQMSQDVTKEHKMHQMSQGTQDAPEERSRCELCHKSLPWAFFEWSFSDGWLFPTRTWCIRCRIEVNDHSRWPWFYPVHKANLARQLQAAEKVEALKAQIEQQNREMQALRELILAQGYEEELQELVDSVSVHSSHQPLISTGYTGAKEKRKNR